jgi:3-hydroxyisobutyrate dehydrogenase
MDQAPTPLGFVGLGPMGQAMSMNLVRSGQPLVVWNRTMEKADPLRAEGATVATDMDDLARQARTIILMLADGPAIDAVLDRRGKAFARRVSGHTIVHMGTTAPAYSHGLEVDIRSAGGRYVEAPVSGSRKPAEAGQLVCMLAGEEDAVAAVRPLLAPMCKQTIVCGAVPKALVMKLAVNILLLATVTGLAEALHFAEQHDLDLAQVEAVLAAGQMASDVTRVKAPKLVQRDFSVHASIADVLKNGRLIADAARAAGIASPVLDTCRDLYEETLGLGHAREDMIAVVKAIEARTSVQRS